MQQKSFSRRLLIFSGAFMVSFMVIYSVYYYKRAADLDRGIVARSGDVPNTTFGFGSQDTTAVAGNNRVISAGLFQSMREMPTDAASARWYSLAHGAMAQPDLQRVGYDSVYTAEGMELLYQRLLRRFQKHPPIDFGDLKEGEKLLFSYFFRNLTLPMGFRKAAARVQVGGAPVKALEYYPYNKNYTNSVTHYYEGPQGKALTVDMQNGGRAVWFSTTSARPDSSLLRPENEVKLTEKDAVLFPEIDFSLQKQYTPADRGDYAALKSYNLVEERIKVKTSIPEGINKKIVHNADIRIRNLDGQVFFYLQDSRSGSLPYFSLRLSHPELLLRVNE